MKLIDWNAMPRGTITTKGELIRCIENHASVLQAMESGTPCILHTLPNSLRIVPATRWTYHTGGACPIPNGVWFNVVIRSGVEWANPCNFTWAHNGSQGDIIAYRITGVDRAGGWTDNPEEVTDDAV